MLTVMYSCIIWIAMKYGVIIYIYWNAQGTQSLITMVLVLMHVN